MRAHAARFAISLISLALIVGALLPARAHAGVLSDIITFFRGNTVDAFAYQGGDGNLQTLSFLHPAMNIDPSAARGGGDITIVDKSALMPEEGPSGTIADIEKPKDPTISVYVVHPGDTLNGISLMFGVSPNTILWANNLPRNATLQVGQVLTILPVTGIRYMVKSGDTLASIAKKYGGDATDVASYNGLDGSSLAVGTVIIIPNGELATPPLAQKSSSAKYVVGKEAPHNVGPQGSASQIAYYISPLASYVETQGIHGYNAVDLAAPKGTPIVAAAAGNVIVARSGGWNGGYGSYVVIQHGNGSQTLYSHMSKVAAYDGEYAQQGQIIGYVGATGLATGPHVHFEIRNGIRNPF